MVFISDVYDQSSSCANYLILPISNSILGGVTFGTPGFMLGGIIGVSDLILHQLNFTDYYYLSWGLTSLSAINVVHKFSVVSNVITFALGATLPSGLLMQNQDYVMSVGAIYLAGFRLGGYGCILTGAMVVLEEILINNNIIDKKYITGGTLGFIFGSYTFNLKYLKLITGIAGIVVVDNYSNIVKGLIPVTFSKQLYNFYEDVLSTKVLNQYIETYSLLIFNSQLILRILGFKLIGYQQNVMYSFEHLDEINAGQQQRFQKVFIELVAFLLPYSISFLHSKAVGSYFSWKVTSEVEEMIYNKWLNEETFLITSKQKNISFLVDNLAFDIRQVADVGSQLSVDILSVSLKGAYGISVVLCMAPDMLIYALIYTQLTHSVSEYLAMKQKDYEELIKVQETKIKDTLRHDLQNVKIVVERDGIINTKLTTQEMLNLKKDFITQGKLWNIINESWMVITSITDFIFNYFIVGYKILNGQLQFDDRIKIHYSASKAGDFFSWNGKNAHKVTFVQQSLDRLKQFADFLNTTGKDIDHIVRVIDDVEYLKIYNTSIEVANKQLIFIESLELNIGEIYALTGKSGSGKSSLLSKIKGVKENDIGGRGVITYPNNADIVMMSQQDYFIINSRFIDLFFYPNRYSALIQDKISLLLKLIDIMSLNHYELEEIKDWYSVLSGGEKKKIAIISSILKKPSILILDEIFNGLDKNSIYTCQILLKKYLSHSLLIIVDHNAKENNFNSFYTRELFLDNETIYVQKIEGVEKVTFNENMCPLNEQVSTSYLQHYDNIFGENDQCFVN